MELQFILLALLSLFPVALTRETFAENFDTIEISAISDPPVALQTERLKREIISTIQGPDGTRVVVNCKTARKEEGVCKPFKKCYPLFLLRSEDDEIENSQKVKDDLPDLGPYDYKPGNFELESIYRNVSGPCDKQVLDAISSLGIGKKVMDEYVCCPNEKDRPTTQPSLPPAPPTPRPEVVGDNKCGKTFVSYKSEDANVTHGDAASLRIVNGRVAEKGEFPWTVALMNNGRQFCGGSLISDSHILCAAHCVYYMNQRDVSKMRIYIGDHNIYSTADGPSEVRSVSNVYYHKSFSMSTLLDDISVIRLSKPVKFGRYIQPVCLHQGSPRYDTGSTHADVMGWGQVSAKGRPSDFLRTVQVRVLTNNECAKAYGNKAPAGITSGMVCAGGNGRDSCKGDSGSPITVNSHTQTRLQIGVVSWGIGCATYPGVYTRVDKYLPWIYKNQR